jgi:hypothetical protein
MAMARIYKRIGYKDDIFFEIRDKLIKKYGIKGATT